MSAAAEPDRHILVTGIHRSGTTFVGRMLSTAPHTGYIQEPFNPDLGVNGIDTWYLYIREGMPEEERYAGIVRSILSGRARYRRRTGHAGGMLRKFGRKVGGSRDYLEYLASTRLPGSRRLILKDPVASLSSEWFHRRFGMDVLILLRHPAGFITSTMRLGWDFDFSNLTSQAPLMEEHLGGILDSVDTVSMSPLERGALLWRCIYSVLAVIADRNPGVRMIRLEDISSSPVEEFKEIHRYLDLPFTERSLRAIREFTGTNNPVGATEGEAHSLRRSSGRLAGLWRNSLDEAQAARIRELAGPVAERYYREDW
jgi:hypothetical protein